MLLTGTHPRTLDEKKRLALPKRIRELLGEPKTLFLTPGPDLPCLFVYTLAELQRAIDALPERLRGGIAPIRILLQIASPRNCARAARSPARA